MVTVLTAALVAACGGLQQERAGGAGGATAGPSHPATQVAGSPAAGGVLLRQTLREQARLWNVTYPMLSESVEICRDRIRPNFGFVAWTRWDIERSYRIASMGAFGLDDRLRVVHVLPGSPAAAAGLLAGDEIERVGRHRMPAGQSASTALELALQEKALDGAAQSFQIRRANARYHLEIVPRPQCDVDLIVTDSNQVGAYNLGRSVYMTYGLMRRLDDELALAAVAAHFAGHGVLGHYPPGREATVAGKLQSQFDDMRWALMDEDEKAELRKTGALPGTRPYTEEQERHADRVALEFMARAGYPVEAVIHAWDRLANVQGDKLGLWRSHAPRDEREGAVRDVLSEVRGENGHAAHEPGS